MKCRIGADNAAAALSLLYALVTITATPGMRKPGFFEHQAAGYPGQTDVEEKDVNAAFVCADTVQRDMTVACLEDGEACFPERHRDGVAQRIFILYNQDGCLARYGLCLFGARVAEGSRRHICGHKAAISGR